MCSCFSFIMTILRFKRTTRPVNRCTPSSQCLHTLDTCRNASIIHKLQYFKIAVWQKEVLLLCTEHAWWLYNDSFWWPSCVFCFVRLLTTCQTSSPSCLNENVPGTKSTTDMAFYITLPHHAGAEVGWESTMELVPHFHSSLDIWYYSFSYVNCKDGWTL